MFYFSLAVFCKYYTNILFDRYLNYFNMLVSLFVIYICFITSLTFDDDVAIVS